MCRGLNLHIFLYTMFRKIFLVLLLFQVSFAMDPSIVKVLGCLEKKRMSVLSVEKIDGKIYVKGNQPSSMEMIVVDDKTFDVGESVFEYKKDCLFQEKNYLDGVKHRQRKGLLGATKNSNRDSIVVLKKNKVLWSCPQEKRNVADIRVLDQSKLVISCSNIRDLGDTLWLLDDKCRWTLFEPDAKIYPYGFVVGGTVFPDNIGASSQFLTYSIGKLTHVEGHAVGIRQSSYTVAFDSSWNRHWGTSLSFWVSASVRNVGCGYHYFKNPDDTDQNLWVVKCARWTGNNFVEFTLPYEVRDRNEHYPVLGTLFPCGDGICVQNRETKK